MRRALVVTVVLATLAACSSFGEEEEVETPSTDNDGGTTPDSGTSDGGRPDATPTLDGGGGDVVEIKDAGPPPPSCSGTAIVQTGFDIFPLATSWGLDDSNNALQLDTVFKTAGVGSLKAGSYNDSVRGMTSWGITYGTPKSATKLCLAIDLALVFSAAPSGFVEVLQLDLYPPGATAGQTAYFGVGADSTSVFLNVTGTATGTRPKKTIPIALKSEQKFHRWTFTADVTGMAAWVDATQVARESFPITSFESLQLSVGVQGGAAAPRPTVTSWFDQLTASFLPL